MATTRELIDRRKDPLFGIGVVGREGGIDPLVAEALASAPPAKTAVTPTADPNTVNVTLGGALGGATVPLTTGAAAPAPSPAPVAPVMQNPEVAAPETNSFYDLILQNDAFRLANKEAFDRQERSNRARTTIAAVTDALASLGNLVGTTQGAFSQPQTYQTPFVAEDVESGRARARSLADRLQASDNTIRLAQAREDMTTDAYARRMALQQALEDEKTRRALAQIQGRADLEGQKHGYRTEENAQRAGYTREQHDIDNAVRQEIAAGRNATSASNKDKDIAFKRDELEAKKNGEIGSGGGVGGYTTTETETVHRDDLGNVTSREKVKTRTAKNGQTTTTTKERKPNPMGSAPQQGQKKKKKNPMN